MVIYTLHLSHTQGYKNLWIIKITLKIKPNSKPSTPTLEYNVYFILPLLYHSSGNIYLCLII